MRETAVPCINATFFEFKNSMHSTWNDDRVCSRCLKLSDRLKISNEINSRGEK